MTVERVLSAQEARGFYDSFGAKQDWQRFYEDPAIDVLVGHGDFESAKSVVEFGCGTGRLAERLLRGPLPAQATYAGFDISGTMVDLARARVAPWSDRAKITLTEGSPVLPLPDGSCDRFLSTYVLDLLGEEDIRAALREAERLLASDGRLCLASMTFGQTMPSRLFSRAWSAIQRADPRLVGGCRPLHLERFTGKAWRISHQQVVCTFGMCTEVVVASKIGASGSPRRA
jgi:ubiquinone/menaquinone biosynthesis C-methylase UbiE